MKTIFIDGSTGATGVRLKEYLEPFESNNEVLYSHSGESLENRLIKARQSDITVFCLPEEASKEMVSSLDNYGGVIIDTSSAYRQSPNWFYAHPSKLDLIDSNMKRIANPGCFASGMISMIEPISEILKPSTEMHIFGVTGFSAGGKSLIEKQEKEPITFKNTNLGRTHTHESEVSGYFNDKYEVIFTPNVGNFPFGQMVTLSLTKENLVKTINESFEMIKKKYESINYFNVFTNLGSIDIQNYPKEYKIKVNLSKPNDKRVQINFLYDNMNIGSAGNVMEILKKISVKPV